VDANGQIHYLGLSLFHTKNGAYIGNILATEEKKREMMARYLPIDLLDDVKQRIIENAQLAHFFVKKLGSIAKIIYICHWN
jgi:hypothetical protein